MKAAKFKVIGYRKEARADTLVFVIRNQLFEAGSRS